MADRMKFSDQVTVGPQPSIDELRQLPEDGFQTVINFRTAGEEEQPLSPDEEASQVRELGMQYLHVPVSAEDLRTEQVDEFRSKYAELPKPAFAHCKSGKRAGAFVMMHVACEQGWSGEETLKKAEEMGFECDKPELVEFVKNYVDQHR